MSTDARAERARRWLGEQIDQLKALRNAKTRDSDFKQWRQATLTIIQRIWAGDARRSARFRRIPFSPPSTQADGREMREFYERGCAEALQLLTAGLEEIEKNGLPAETASARPASLDPGVAEDDFPTLDLPGVGAEAADTADTAEPAEPAESENRSASERPRSNGVSVRGEKDDDRVEHGGSSLRQGAAERRRRQKKGGPRRRLRDMLGLDALEKLAGDRDAPDEVSEIKARENDREASSEVRGNAPAPSSSSGDARSRRLRSDDDLLAAEDANGAAEGSDTPSPVVEKKEKEKQKVKAEAEDEAVRPAADVRAERSPAAEEDAADFSEENDGLSDEESSRSAADFLSASPVFKSEGRPVRRPTREPRAATPPAEDDFTPAPLTSSTAIAVAAIAAEVARLGVPEGHRARTRASLVSLAQLVEDDEIDWDGLRGAVAFAMEFPPVGRRLLPLLIPFLDRAA
jgi:hypothetical protein